MKHFILIIIYIFSFSSCSIVKLLNDDKNYYNESDKSVTGFFESKEGRFYIQTSDSLGLILYDKIDSINIDTNSYYISSSYSSFLKSNLSLGIFRGEDKERKLNDIFKQLQIQLFDQYKIVKEDSSYNVKKRHFIFLKGKKYTETSNKYLTNLLIYLSESTDSYAFSVFIMRVNYPDPSNSDFETQSINFKYQAEIILNGLHVLK